MKRYTGEKLTKRQYILGESPAYDPERDVLSWVDVKGCRLCKRSPGGTITETEVGQNIGAAVPMKNGNYFGALTTGLYEIADNGICFVCRPQGFLDGQRANDAKVDPSGRLWFGTMSLFAGGTGDLYLFDGKRCSCRLRGTGVSNGMAWSPDKEKMYYIDTLTGRVDVFDYRDGTGEISGRRPCVSVKEGLPDGMTIDREGMLWVALWGAGCVARYHPATGKMLAKVELPTPNVSSCCFAGKNLDVLTITTSAEGIEGSDAGCVYCAHVDTCGIPERYPAC